MEVNNNQFQMGRPTGFPGFTQSTLNRDNIPYSQPAPNNQVTTRKLKAQRKDVAAIRGPTSNQSSSHIDNQIQESGRISTETNVRQSLSGNSSYVRQTPIANQYTEPFKQTVQEKKTTLGSFEYVYALLPQDREVIN